MKTLCSGLILAGGQARRMNGCDKGLLEWRGQPLVAQVIARLRPQVNTLLISANRNLAAYQAFGYPLLQDSVSDFPGPLAGMLTGLQQMHGDYLLTAPCDAPCLPLDLGERLWRTMQQHAAALCVAHDGCTMQPTFALLHKDLQTDLSDYLARGERRVQAWMQAQNGAYADFSDQPQAFLNLNTPVDLMRTECG